MTIEKSELYNFVNSHIASYRLETFFQKKKKLNGLKDGKMKMKLQMSRNTMDMGVYLIFIRLKLYILN